MDAKKTLVSFGPGWAWALFVLLWFFLPLLIASPSATPELGFPAPLRLPAALASGGAAFSSVLGAVVVWSALVLALWKAASFFLVSKIAIIADPDQPVAMGVDIAASAAVLTAHILHTVVFADKAAFFASYPWWAWASVALALAYNAFSVLRLIATVAERDAGYREYLAFRKAAAAVHADIRGGIQQRLTLIFTALLLTVVGVLATALLNDFGATILAAVIDNGGAIAERTATVAKTNAGDRIAVSDYFTVEGEKNKKASFPFKSLAYFRLDPKTGAFQAASWAGTEEAPMAPEGIQAPTALEILHPEKGGDVEFRAPVILAGKTIGYANVIYDRDVIYGPYFRTTVKAAIIAFIFLYVSIFLTYLIGRGIVSPILFLGMSVNNLSTRLAAMVGGNERVSAERLRYEDRVATKDEIKRLSTEIGNMATVIRGVVPYISASTLKHANRDTPSTESRDLAFLFTDIRGFTTLCEGRSPEEVVSLLNRYLDIQTAAILANGGDVDKFVGDEVMAMFDGPEKELNACRAGMAIRKAMAEEQEKARAASSALISIGIGVNSGPVVFGSVGARDRMDFTSIGDTVNLAARLEGANKTYGTKSLITESVYEHVKDLFLCREIDLMTVKGKSKPVRIYEVLQESAKSAPKLLEIKKGFEAGLQAYRKRQWKEAVALFGTIAEKFNDEPSAVFKRRSELFVASPPAADWNGVFAMTVK